jgi:dihydropteroate synthase
VSVPSVSLRGQTLSLEEPVLMGIVNATPDSFSDPQRPKGLDELVERAEQLSAEGAELIDVGGESGRTDRPVVPEDEELCRVVPLVERLAGTGLTVSVDTWRTRVARAALAAGAAMVNDVSGLSDPEIADACAECGAALVVTHTRMPPKRRAYPAYDDVVDDVIGLLAERSAEARRRGVADDQLVLDPGVDLAKTPAESVALLRRLGEVRALGRPLLLALSRKDFIGAITGRPPAERLAGTLATVGAMAEPGSILRVHDVAAARDYLAVRAALRGEREVPPDMRLAEALRREPEALDPA